MAHDSDFLVIGGGIAGAAAAFNLAGHGQVQILEMEDAPGYHTTGRSAALYTETYGNRVVRAITSASRDFLSHPPEGFVDGPVLTPRGTLLAATAETEAVLDQAERDADALGAVTERLHGNALFDRAPYLARTVVTGGLFEPAAMDMDVDLLHRGFLRGTARQGGQLTCRAPVHTLTRDDGKWIAATPAGDFRAPVVVNAAGAWADHIAELAGVAAIGLIPKRRSAFTFDAPESLDLEAMPATIAVDESWYVKPEAGRLLASPADETPSPACDAQPEELDLAIAADRVQRHTDFTIRRMHSRWAGLRSFVADKTFVVGFAPGHDGFLWCAGQGGYGIQTSAAMGEITAALAIGAALPAAVTDRGVTAADLSPGRPALAG